MLSAKRNKKLERKRIEQELVNMGFENSYDCRYDKKISPKYAASFYVDCERGGFIYKLKNNPDGDNISEQLTFDSFVKEIANLCKGR